MAKNEAKINFLAETEDFRKNVSEASSKLTELRSELRLNAEQMKTSGESADLLADRQRILQDQLGQAESKTQALAAQMEACTRHYGANSTEAQKLATQINNAKIAEEKIKQELGDVNAKLDDQKSDANDAADALNELESETEDAANAAKDAADGFTVWKGTLANLASSAIQNALNGIKNLGASVWGLGDDTRELRTEMGKLDAAFSASELSADTARDTYETLYGVIGETDQSVEAAQQIALLSNNTEDAAKWADLAAGVVGRFGDALQPETFFEAANETLKLGEATGAYTQMLEGTGMSVEKFNTGLAAAKTEEEKQAYMLEVTNKALGAAGEAYKQNNAQIIEANEAQSNYNNGLAGLGEIVEPLKTTFMNGMASMLESVTQFLSGFDTEELQAKIQGAFDYLNNTVFPAIKTGIQWFIDNKDIIIAGIAGIVAGIAAFKVITIVQKAIQIFKTFNLTLATNPIGLVALAIGGLVTAFVLLWKNCEGFRNFWIDLWEIVKNAASTAWNGITSIFKAAWEAIKAVWNFAKPFFMTVWDNIKAVFSVVKTVLSGFFSTAWAAIKLVWNTVAGYFKAVWNTIKGVFAVVKSVLSGNWRDAWNAIKGIVGTWKNYFSNIWSGIKNVFSSVKSWFSNTFSAAWDAVKRVFSNWGSFFGGLWTSIKDKFSSIGTSIANAIGGAVKSGINGVISAIEKTINSGIKLINGAIRLINKIPGVNIGNICTVSFPRLASGGVVRQATFAEIGEYAGARTNPEIVTPQNIMRETFAETLNTFLASGSYDLARLVDAVEDLASRPIRIAIGDRDVAEATASASDNVSGYRLNLRNRGLAL